MTEFGMAPLNDWAGTVKSLSNDGPNALDCEAHLGRSIVVQRHYNPAGSSAMNHDVKDALDHGRKVYVEFSTQGTVQSNWAAGARGELDPWMRTIASVHAPFADRLYVVIHHEPDADAAGNGTPADFLAFFSRFSGILKATADFTIVANQTRNAFHTTKGVWTPDLHAFDLFSLDGYNSGRAKWRSFEELFAEGHAYAGHIGKPFCIGETGCVESKKEPSAKASWFREQDLTLDGWVDDVAFVCNTHHFNGKGSNYTVSTSPASAEAFVALAHSFAG